MPIHTLMILVMVGCLPARTLVDQSNERAASLVKQLGDRSFMAREKAGDELARMGIAAYRALRSGSESPNAEVRSRCRRLIPAIAAQVLRNRLDEFERDPNLDNDHDLPGWKRFRALVGEDKKLKPVFVGMLRNNLPLFEQLEAQPDSVSADLLSARCVELQLQQRMPDGTVRSGMQINDILALLFIGANPKLSPTAMSIQQVGSLTYQPMFRQGLSSPESAVYTKKILLAWIDRHIDDRNISFVVSNIAMNGAAIKELVPPLLRIAVNKTATPFARAQSIVALGKIGDKDVTPKLEDLFKDDSVVSNFVWNNIRGITQVRDVALAMALHLNGEKPGEYGYEALKANATLINSYYYLGFSSEQKRIEAMDKWTLWKAAKK